MSKGLEAFCSLLLWKNRAVVRRLNQDLSRDLCLPGDLDLLVDHLLDVFRSSGLYRKQAAFCINHVVRGHRVAPPTGAS